jgi:hypothetical protein
MNLRLLEIELNSDNPGASRRFYNEILGLDMYADRTVAKFVFIQ